MTDVSIARIMIGVILTSLGASTSGPGAETAGRAAAPVLVLVSSRAPAYTDAADSVTSVLKKRFPDRPVTTVIMEGLEGAAAARGALGEDTSVVVAVGTRAARLASESTAAPLIYAMVLDPASIGLPAPGSGSTRGITGIAMDVSFEKQFALMRELVPGLARIGVIYDPSISGSQVRRAAAAAKATGLTLVRQSVRSETEVLAALTMVGPGVDALLTVADPTVLTHANSLALILFSLRTRMPLFAMSEGYVRNGALAAVAAHPQEVGRRAGEMVSEILTGGSIAAMEPEMPPAFSVFLNEATARRLGLALPDSAVSRARMIYPRP